MISTIVQALYFLLKSIGLWEKLQAEHKAQELSDAQQSVNVLSDDDAIKQLHKQYDHN